MLNPNKCTKTKPKPTLILRTARVCVSLCTTVVHNTAKNSSDNFLSYTPDMTDSHHSSDDVYWREGGTKAAKYMRVTDTMAILWATTTL